MTLRIIQAKNYLETVRRAKDAAKKIVELAAPDRELDAATSEELVAHFWGPITPDRHDSPEYRKLVAAELEALRLVDTVRSVGG